MPRTKIKTHQVVWRLSEVQDERLEWLWPGRLALGKPTLLDGDPGLGKSLVTLDVAARLTRGLPLPDGVVPRQPVPVVLVGSEDGLRDTILPRLRAAGADLDLVQVFAGQVRDRLWNGWPTFPEDCRLLTATVWRARAGLIVIDPLTAYLGGRGGGLSEGPVRRALAPLAQLAARTRAAMIWVRHLAKSRSGQAALYRGSGSIAIAGAARSAFLLGTAPDDPDLRVLACTKNNLALPPAALGFRIQTNPAGLPVVAWTGKVGLAAQELLAAHVPFGQALEQARKFLQELLQAGPRPMEEVRRRAEAAAISAMTLRRAREDLDVRRLTSAHTGTRLHYWALPQAREFPLPSPEIHNRFLREAAERGARFIQRLCDLPLPSEDNSDGQPADHSRDGP